MRIQTYSGLDAAPRSIADQVAAVRDWHQVSQSLGQGRFATVSGSARTVRGEPPTSWPASSAGRSPRVAGRW